MTVPKGPCSTGSVLSLMARGLSVPMFEQVDGEAERVGGVDAVVGHQVVDDRDGESQPSLLRSLPVWSEIRNSPPPFCTNFMIAVFSAALSSDVGLGQHELVEVAQVQRVGRCRR